MKWIRVFASVFLLMVLFCGCNSHQEPEPVVTSSSYKTADELIEEAESREKEEILSRAERTFGRFAGTYLCSSQEIDAQYWPMLELSFDGKAVFHANLLTGMGELRGTYAVDGDTVKLAVEEVSFTGFAGETVTDMVFRFVSDDTLELSYTTPDTPVGITNAGDQFVKKQEETVSEPV